jgi:hypothetical protein
MYRNAIRYKVLPKITESEEFSYSAWFCMKDYYNNQQLLKKPHPVFGISLESSNADQLIFNSYPRKHNLEKWTSYDVNPEGYVAIKGDKEHTGGYRVIDVIDEYRFTFNNNPDADFYSNLNYYKKHGEFPEINYIQESRTHRDTYIQKYGYTPDGLTYEDTYRLKPLRSKGS